MSAADSRALVKGLIAMGELFDFSHVDHGTGWPHHGLDHHHHPLDDQLGAPMPDAGRHLYPHPGNLGPLHGNPQAAAPDWFAQKANGYCLPASLTEILSQVTGHRFSDESVVVKRLEQLGMPTTSAGHQFSDGVALLRSFGIESRIQTGATLGDLKNYLDEGRGIILGVDANDVWFHHQGPTQDNPHDQLNHALLLTGIDEARGVAILSDPGNPHGGNEETIPLAQFQQAWGDGGNTLLVTTEPILTTAHPDADPVELPHSATRGQTSTHPGFVVLPVRTYTVAPGDTLWDIAARVDGNPSHYQRIATANAITNPNLIHPGQVLTIPT